jgi:hypothetical protein
LRLIQIASAPKTPHLNNCYILYAVIETLIGSHILENQLMKIPTNNYTILKRFYAHDLL